MSFFLVKFAAKCGTSKKALFYHLSNQYFLEPPHYETLKFEA